MKAEKPEEALQKERDFISAVLDTAGALVVVLDRQGRIVRFNRTCERVTGYSFDEVRGRHIWDLLLIPEEIEPIKAIFESLQAGQPPSEYESYWVAKDGSRRLIVWSNTVLLDREGSIEYVVGTGIDITDRKRAEEALSWVAAVNVVMAEIARALLQSDSIAEIATLVLESAQHLTGSAFGFVGYIDPQTGYLVCPIKAQEIWDAYRVPGEADAFKTSGGLWGRAPENRRPVLTNAAADDPHATGTPPGPIPIQRFLAVPALIGETLVGQVALANSERDYSERDLAFVEQLAALYALAIQRKRAEEAVQESERRFRDLFENAPLCLFEVDLEQRPPIILRANRRATEVYGWSPEEFSAVPITKLAPEQATPDLQRTLDMARAGETITLESINLRRDGSAFPVRISVTQQITSGPSRSVVAIEDITAEKARRSEEEAIAEERRRIAREIHDGLAQDLAALCMQVGLWHHIVDNDPAQMHAELEFLNDLLRKNIREVRRSIFALRSVALDKLGFFPALRQFITEFGEQHQMYVDLHISGPQDRLRRELEPVLFRIVQEALNNAGKHAQAHTVWIALDLEAGDAVALTVRDDGVGFDPATLEQAVRLGHLGLQQMRERVENLGGTLLLQSQEGIGTTIQVTLPLFRKLATVGDRQ